ncbi:selenocysteine-specific translation elongation factor [Chloroflexota bacterium]
MFVLGTAGHVDHGKSVLVHALTGIDPDRLPEEKERGMTIDLGFAWLKLPSGQEVSIVDVPGHERFVKNMIAGVGGIDLVLLVVAADEGVMPQTREHLAIINLLEIERGLVAITKKDLVDSEWLELVTLDVQESLKETLLAEAPIFSVSGVTKEGLPALVSGIDSLLGSIPPKKDIGRPRLAIDRVFTIAGSGTVVTGTLLDGSFSQGQKVEVLPCGIKTRIRGLQTHQQAIDVVQPGNRVGINLANVSTDQLQRGDIVTTPDWLRPAIALDVKIRLLPDAPHPLRHNTTVAFHSGASEVMVKVRLLDRDVLKPDETGWAQLALTKATPVVQGDRFIIRSSRDTLGGGDIIDPYPRRHRRFYSDTLDSLAAREKGDPGEVLLNALKLKQPADLSTLVAQCQVPQSVAEVAVQNMVSGKRMIALGRGGARLLLFTIDGWQRLADKTTALVSDYHKRFPLRRGMPKEELRSRLKLTPHHFEPSLLQLVAEGKLDEKGTTIHLTSHSAQLNAEQQKTTDAFLKSLAQNPYSPSTESLPESELLNLLIDQAIVVKVSDQIIYLASAYNEMVERITRYLKEQGKITVAEVRDLFQTSRKYALALMEYLDGRGVTRRIGDNRVLMK